MRMRVITLPLLAKTVDPTHRATWRVHALASSWVFPNCIRRRSPSRLCVYWKWTNSKASCTPVDPYSLSSCHIVSIGMSNRHKSHVDACFLFLLRPSPSFPYFSKKSRDFFLCGKRSDWKLWKQQRSLRSSDQQSFLPSFISLSLSLSGHFYLTFPSTFLFVNFCASQLFAPSVIDDIPLSIRLIITPRLLPLLVGNVKVVKLKPVQPAKYSSCVWVTRSKSHWVGQRLGSNPLFL